MTNEADEKAKPPSFHKSLVAFQENAETQGMGTVERPEGPNGEVPRPLRSLVSLWNPLVRPDWASWGGGVRRGGGRRCGARHRG